MKRIYLTPAINLQPIDSTEDFLDESLPMFDANNDQTPSDLIDESNQILGNGASIWETTEEEE
jgi:hypothetical protein